MSNPVTVTNPDGREVVLTTRAWRHVLDEHAEMEGHRGAILATIERPDFIEPDERDGRERYFRRGFGPARWLRVVVAFEHEPARVVTAFGQDEEP